VKKVQTGSRRAKRAVEERRNKARGEGQLDTGGSTPPARGTLVRRGGLGGVGEKQRREEGSS